MANAPSSPSTGDLAKVFARFDADGDGLISSSELAGILRALGSEASPKEVAEMIDAMDADRDGFVNLTEFVAFYRGGAGVGGADAELMDAFKMYDLDSNGKISAQELHQVLMKLGEKCSVNDCSRMIKSVDSDGDGSVNFEEFKKMMNGGARKSDATEEKADEVPIANN